jgi:hypothetical protein
MKGGTKGGRKEGRKEGRILNDVSFIQCFTVETHS